MWLEQPLRTPCDNAQVCLPMTRVRALRRAADRSPLLESGIDVGLVFTSVRRAARSPCGMALWYSIALALGNQRLLSAIAVRPKHLVDEHRGPAYSGTIGTQHGHTRCACRCER
jgi:hypothetical protein